MDFNNVLEALGTGLETVKKLAPLATELGMPDQVGNVLKIASGVVSIAVNVKRRIDDGAIVVAGEDAAKVEAIIAELQAENDRLAAAINAS